MPKLFGNNRILLIWAYSLWHLDRSWSSLIIRKYVMKGELSTFTCMPSGHKFAKVLVQKVSKLNLCIKCIAWHCLIVFIAYIRIRHMSCLMYFCGNTRHWNCTFLLPEDIKKRIANNVNVNYDWCRKFFQPNFSRRWAQISQCILTLMYNVYSKKQRFGNGGEKPDNLLLFSWLIYIALN